jgi:hypothetical protein
MDNRIDMAYAAGVMDGDGSFGIGKLKTNANPLYFPLLQLQNHDEEMLRKMISLFGGTFVTGKLLKCMDGSFGKNRFRWRLRSSANVIPALEQLIPFLKVKKDRAQFLLEFSKSFTFVRGAILTPEKLADRERSYLKMIQYNDWTSFDNNISLKLAKKNTSDPIFWSYMAGIMDTDGSFSIKRQNKNKGTHVINPRYLPVISLSMCDTRSINYLRENCYLGKLYMPKNRSCKGGFHYQYGIYSRDESIIFLENIIPFLRFKKENARQLLEFCQKYKQTKYCLEGIPKEELDFREKCYQNLISLNKYGVYKSPLIVLKTLPGNAEGNKVEAAQACTMNAVSEETPKGDAVL